MKLFRIVRAHFALAPILGLVSACAPTPKASPKPPRATAVASPSNPLAPSANPPLSSPVPEAQRGAGIPYPRFVVPVAPDRPTMGPAKAPVTIVLFSDFECPYCAKAQQTLDELDTLFPGKIRRVYRAFPLSRQSTAMLAALMAESARTQGKFWAFYRALYSGIRLSAPAIWQMARDAGLDMDKVRQDLQNLTHADTIERDLELARRLGVRATPVFFVNGRRVEGAAPASVFAHYIEQEERLAQSLNDSKTPVYEQLTQHGFAGVRPAKRESSRVEIPNQGAPSRGPADAPVRIVVFSDFECPFCARGNQELVRAMASFPGKLRLEFRHLPLPFHKEGKKAARVAVLAQQKGKFWELHDAIYNQQEQLDEALLLRLGENIGLSVADLQSAIEDRDGSFDAVIAKDLALAQSLQVRGTPAYFVNGIAKKGVQPELSLRLLFSREIRAAQQGSREAKHP